MPAFDGSDDFVRIGGPGEGFGVIAALGEEAVDGSLEINDRMEDAALEAAFGESGEEAFHRVEPRTRGRCEVEGEALMPVEPRRALSGGLVSTVVVENDVDGLAVRHFGVDGMRKRMNSWWRCRCNVAADDGAVEHVERGKERGGAVPLVVVMVPSRPRFMGRPGWVRSSA